MVLARPGIVGGTLVVIAGELAGLPWWAAIGIAAAALVAIGLAGGAPRPALTTQTAAVLGFGGLAVVAHHRRNAVVPRSLAEFCIFLDVPLGLALVVLAFTD